MPVLLIHSGRQDRRGKNDKGGKFVWKIGRQGLCSSSNLVNLLQCDKENCLKQYIEVTQQEFCKRICQPLGYVRNKQMNKTTGEHFYPPGHSIHNVTFTMLQHVQQVKSPDPLYGREREKTPH